MKKLKNFLLVAVVALLVACSGAVSYNPEVCASLEKKISDRTELTTEDYDQMISQVDAIAEALYAEKDKAEKEGKDEKDFFKTPEAKEMGGYLLRFILKLDSDKDKLSQSNVKKFNKVMMKYEEMNKSEK